MTTGPMVNTVFYYENGPLPTLWQACVSVWDSMSWRGRFVSRAAPHFSARVSARLARSHPAVTS